MVADTICRYASVNLSSKNRYCVFFKGARHRLVWGKSIHLLSDAHEENTRSTLNKAGGQQWADAIFKVCRIDCFPTFLSHRKRYISAHQSLRQQIKTTQKCPTVKKGSWQLLMNYKYDIIQMRMRFLSVINLILGCF